MSGFLPVRPQTAPAATSAHEIGDAYIEGHGRCAPGSIDHVDGCFLSDWQRAALVNSIAGRVNAALAAMLSAIERVGFEEALRKAPPDLIRNLVFDAVGKVAEHALSTAASWVRGATPAAVLGGEIAAIGIDRIGTVSSPHSIVDEARKADESSLGIAIKGAIQAGKKSIEGDDQEFERDQASAAGFLSELRTSSAYVFEQQREGPPSVATDGELIVLYHAWSSTRGHNSERYYQEISAIIARFRASSASKIGRTDRMIHHGRPASMHDAVDMATDDAVRDTKLVMEVYSDESAPRLFYFKRDYDALPLLGNDISETTTEVLASRAQDQSFVKLGLVEDEMKDAAMAQNVRVWGKAFDVMHLPTADPAPADFAKPRKLPVVSDNPLAPVHSPVMVTE